MFKLRVYDFWEKFSLNVIGPIFRRTGKHFALNGLKMQGNLASDDRLVPSLRCHKFNSIYPTLNGANFVAPNSVVIGNVKVGENSSLWYGSTLRGEIAEIQIGKNSVIQDLSTIIPRNKDSVVNIGDDVFVGPNCLLEGCTLENQSFIGMGATIRNKATVQSQGVVAAGAVLQEGVEVPTNQIWAGNPAKYLRDLTPEEKQVISEHHQETIQLAKIHAEETEKTFRQIIDDQDSKESAIHEDGEVAALRKIQELGLPMTFDDEDYIEQRVYLREAHAPKESEFLKKYFDPYEQDLFNYPDSFKQYAENFDRYEEAKKFFEQNPNVQAQTIDRSQRNDGPIDNQPWTRKY